MSDQSVNPEAMTPDVDEADKPLPYKRNPAGPCLMCGEGAGRPCDPWCLALLPADQQIQHRDAVLAADLSQLDLLDGVGKPYRLAADCGLGAGRPRADIAPRRRTRRLLILLAIGALLACGALWASQKAHAEYFDVCPSGLSGVASGDTSCAFADNVRAAFYWQPSWTVIATSPVTGKFYTMQCGRTLTDNGWSNPKRCYGVNDAGAVLVVYIA